MEDWVIYCPICSREIEAENKQDVDMGWDDSYIFLHDDVVHEKTDIEALSNGINQMSISKHHRGGEDERA